MSKRGNYTGGSSLIKTMTKSRAKHLDERMYDHLKNAKPRMSDEPLDREEVSKILHAEIKEDQKQIKKRLREHAKLLSKDKKLQERYEFLEKKKSENPSQYPKLNKR
jgi:hypothetical protein